MRTTPMFLFLLLVSCAAAKPSPPSASTQPTVAPTVEDDLPAPPEHTLDDPRCTPIKTAGLHLIGSIDGFVPFDQPGHEILRRAGEANLMTHGLGIGHCAKGDGFYVMTDNPDDGLALQQIVRSVMLEMRLRGTIYVQVAPIRQGHIDSLMH
jgi:hypothetical protein